MQQWSFGFVDHVSGNEVYYYLDRYNRLWLAEGPWAWFRVRVLRP
jgi:hypothetical protein